MAPPPPPYGGQFIPGSGGPGTAAAAAGFAIGVVGLLVFIAIGVGLLGGAGYFALKALPSSQAGAFAAATPCSGRVSQECFKFSPGTMEPTGMTSVTMGEHSTEVNLRLADGTTRKLSVHDTAHHVVARPVLAETWRGLIPIVVVGNQKLQTDEFPRPGIDSGELTVAAVLAVMGLGFVGIPTLNILRRRRRGY